MKGKAKTKDNGMILQIWLTEDEFAAVDVLAEKNRRSRSAMGRELIIEALEQHPDVKWNLSEDQIRDAVRVMKRLAAQEGSEFAGENAAREGHPVKA